MKYTEFDPEKASKEEKREVYINYCKVGGIDSIFIRKKKNSARTLRKITKSGETVEMDSDELFHLRVAFYKLEAWGTLQDAKKEIENPENELAGRTILICLERALRVGITIPEWLYDAFSKKLFAIVHNETKRWSDKDAFGLERPKGAQREKEIKNNSIGYQRS
ncbi:MAG: hypothetical protein HQM08_24130 [Candidatus Riflebacteria bacterium]|nr:hypothetical protein [Candidatus Riflebacteria bacterium]